MLSCFNNTQTHDLYHTGQPFGQLSYKAKAVGSTRSILMSPFISSTFCNKLFQLATDYFDARHAGGKTRSIAFQPGCSNDVRRVGEFCCSYYSALIEG